MKNHIYLGKLEKRILKDLAKHPNSLIQPIQKRLMSYYKNVYDAIENLKGKGLVMEGNRIKSDQGAEYTSYKLSEQGLIYVLASNNVDYEIVLENYESETQFLATLGPVLSEFPDKAIRKTLINTAAQMLLTYNIKEPDIEKIMAVSMAGATTFLNALDNGEKETVKQVFKGKKGVLGKAYKITKTLLENDKATDKGGE